MIYARVEELADSHALGACGRKALQVRLLPRAPVWEI